MRWKVLNHPPYSLELSSCDFHVFSPLKIALKDCRFMLDNDSKTTTVLVATLGVLCRGDPMAFTSLPRIIPKQGSFEQASYICWVQVRIN
jgi:hypothetical protein